MLNARLYRAALIPFVLALAVCAFSLGPRPAPLASLLTSDAFEGPAALAELHALAAAAPARRAGSAGDERLAAAVAGRLRGLGQAGAGGFSVHVQQLAGATLEGQRRLLDVVAERPGSTAASPIVIVAHRDAADTGAQAELSGTAVMLELARVLAARATHRPLVLVSTSGGSAGTAGAAALLEGVSPMLQRTPADAAIVLGDLASAHVRKPLVLPYSDGYGLAPLQLQRTVEGAILRQTGSDPGAPSTLGQLVHLAVPLAVGEQGELLRGGVPAVLVQASGEAGPPATAPVSAERLEALGRSALDAVAALDTSPDVEATPQTALVLDGKTVPAWAVRLLALTLLLAPGGAALDALARARRRRLRVAPALLWTLSCALPFLACALFVYLLGRLGIVPRLDAPPPPAAAPVDGAAASVLASVGLTFVLAWLLRAALVRRLGDSGPDADLGGLAAVLVLVPVGLLAWLWDPYTALLVIPAANLLLALSAAELRPGRLPALVLGAIALVPLGLLLAFYARQLGAGPLAGSWLSILALAGGHTGLGGTLLWSTGLGAAVAALCVAAKEPPAAPPPSPLAPARITIRGPLSYAGPGSLGGTESALRR